MNNSVFMDELHRLLSIPGVSKKRIADWCDVDPSTVTRWTQGAEPANTEALLRRIRPEVEDIKRQVAARTRPANQVRDWDALFGSLPAGIQEYVEQTGLLAANYTVIICWIPSSRRASGAYDVVSLRYFQDVWADMSRRVYNLGDQAQIVAFGSCDETPTFKEEKELTDITRVKVKIDEEVGKSVARIHVQLDLADNFEQYDDNSIGFIGDFAYRFRATQAFVATRTSHAQTNDFLGAPSVIPSSRFNLIVALPESCVRGSPSSISSANRSMLKLLMQLDTAAPADIETLLWPMGRKNELSSHPDAPLRALPRMSSTIRGMPAGLQGHLNDPIAYDEPDGDTIAEVLRRDDTTAFLLDLTAPHPSLTHNIVWRLPPFISDVGQYPERN